MNGVAGDEPELVVTGDGVLLLLDTLKEPFASTVRVLLVLLLNERETPLVIEAREFKASNVKRPIEEDEVHPVGSIADPKGSANCASNTSICRELLLNFAVAFAAVGILSLSSSVSKRAL
jgi:hypothetical protein